MVRCMPYPKEQISSKRLQRTSCPPSCCTRWHVLHPYSSDNVIKSHNVLADPWTCDYQDIPEMDPQSIPQGMMVSTTNLYRKYVVYKQLKVHNFIVSKYINNSMYLTFHFHEAMEEVVVKKEKDSQGSLYSIIYHKVWWQVLMLYKEPSQNIVPTVQQ